MPQMFMGDVLRSVSAQKTALYLKEGDDSVLVSITLERLSQMYQAC